MAGFNINLCIPTEEDFREVAEAKVTNDKSRALGGFSCLDDANAPYYYLLVRRFFACMLLKWTEAAKACESLLINTKDSTYDAAAIKQLISLVQANKAAFIDSYNKYKGSQEVPTPEVNLGKPRNHEVTPEDRRSSRAGEVKVLLHGKTTDFYRIIVYDMRYGGSGAKRNLAFGKKENGLYQIKILGAEQMVGKRCNDAVLFKTVNEAKMFIANINHHNINTSYELDSLRYCISDEPIDSQHYDWASGGMTSARVDSLDNAVQVNTMCGKAYILKDSEVCMESLEINNMNEAIEKHNELNQKIFDGNKLKHEVRQKAEDVINEFLKILAEEDVKINVRDVILTGSNASYNYTKDSDIDLHVIAETKSFEESADVYAKLYRAYGRIFGNKFEISFYGIPVEIYVETESDPVVSNGIYSVMFDQWVKEPSAIAIPEIDQKAIDEAAKPWIEEAKALVKEVDDNVADGEEKIDDYITRLYELRQKGIYSTAGNEYSTENLIFKEVRNAGLLDKLKKLKNVLISKKLSLEEGIKYLDDDHEFKDFGTGDAHEKDVIDIKKASTFGTQDLLDGSVDATYDGVVYDIVEMTPTQYFELCSKIQDMKPDEIINFIGADERQLAHVKDVILKYGKKLPLPYVSFSSVDEVSGQEGRHRMYALGEMFGWDEDFPVMLIQDASAKKTLGELLHESITEDFYLDEKTRRDYIVKITQLTHNQPVIQQNGIFQIYNIKEDDYQLALNALRRQPWVEYANATAGKFDFNKISYQGMPSRLYTISGKIKI